MVTLEGFDAKNVEPNSPLTAVPAGTYLVVIESSEKKATRKGDGHYLELVLQVISGDYSGRKIWDRLNMWNKSKVAAGIAQGMLSSICRSVDTLQPNDSSDLHNKPLLVTVKTEKYEGNLKNVVVGYTKQGDEYSEPSDPQEINADGATQASLNEIGEKAPWDN